VIQVPERLVPAGYASFMIVMATGRFTGDRLALRFGRNRMVRLSGLLIFTGLLILVTLPFLVSGIIGCMLTGFGVSSIIPLTYSTAGKVDRVPNSIAIATVSGIGYFGFLLGPPIIGFVAEATGLQYSFLLMAIAGVAINLLVRRIGLFG
jgi:MFS family permease